MGRHHCGAEFTRGGGIANFKRHATQRLAGTQQAEAAGVIDANHGGRHDAAVAGDQQHRVGFELEVTNG